MKSFTLSCVAILTATASAKLYTAMGGAGVLALADPVLGLPNRAVLFGAAAVELAAVAFLLLSGDPLAKCACVCWLASCFCLYRVGMSILHPGAPCPCLGNVTDRLGLKPQTANWLMLATIVYMLVAGGVLMQRERRRRRSEAVLPPGRVQ